MIVNVKGTGEKIRFPDDMRGQDVLDALRNRYPRTVDEAASDALTPKQSQAIATNPTLADKTKQKIADFLFDNGIVSDRYGAQRIGDNLSMALGALPVIGDAQAGDEFGRAVAEGDSLGMGIGALAAIPVVGDAASKGVRRLNKLVDIEKNKFDEIMKPLKEEFRSPNVTDARKQEIRNLMNEYRKPLDAANSKLFIAARAEQPKPKRIPEKEKPVKKFEGKVYHQTNEEFDEFDLNKSADGTVWFTDSMDNFSNPSSSAAAASGKGKIMEREVKLNKVAGYEELDKFSVQELIEQGYDGAVLGSEVQVFDSDAIKNIGNNQ